jgi:hypothetical protein
MSAQSAALDEAVLMNRLLDKGGIPASDSDPGIPSWTTSKLSFR